MTNFNSTTSTPTPTSNGTTSEQKETIAAIWAAICQGTSYTGLLIRAGGVSLNVEVRQYDSGTGVSLNVEALRPERILSEQQQVFPRNWEAISVAKRGQEFSLPVSIPDPEWEVPGVPFEGTLEEFTRIIRGLVGSSQRVWGTVNCGPQLGGRRTDYTTPGWVVEGPYPPGIEGDGVSTFTAMSSRGDIRFRANLSWARHKSMGPPSQFYLSSSEWAWLTAAIEEAGLRPFMEDLIAWYEGDSKKKQAQSEAQERDRLARQLGISPNAKGELPFVPPPKK